MGNRRGLYQVAATPRGWPLQPAWAKSVHYSRRDPLWAVLLSSWTQGRYPWHVHLSLQVALGMQSCFILMNDLPRPVLIVLGKKQSFLGREQCHNFSAQLWTAFSMLTISNQTVFSTFQLHQRRPPTSFQLVGCNFRVLLRHMSDHVEATISATHEGHVRGTTFNK